MKVSVCIATYDRPRVLCRVLGSIYRQHPPFDFDVIVVDDGSPGRETWEVCQGEYPQVHYVRISREPGYRNPAKARNIAYRAARGKIIVSQSDDVEHQGAALEGLASALIQGHFVLATVLNVDPETRAPVSYAGMTQFTGPLAQRPLLFLGAIWRRDLYAVGGCEERFTELGRDDYYLADCLMRGRGLRPLYLDNVIGHHLHHTRPPSVAASWQRMRRLYREIVREGRWIASGGPWPLNGAPPGGP